MSLFVGNVSKHVSHSQLQILFKKFGKCRIDLRDRYAFIQFDNDNHGQQAKQALQHQAFHGLELNIQWSKNSGRFGQNKGGRKNQSTARRRSRSREGDRWYGGWKREDRWERRSPSCQRRSQPSYQGNQDVEGFQPQCQRDQIIKRKLLAKKEQSKVKRSHQAQNSKKTSHIIHQQISYQTFPVSKQQQSTKQTIQYSRTQVIVSEQQNKKIQKIIEQGQQDGQIQTK